MSSRKIAVTDEGCVVESRSYSYNSKLLNLNIKIDDWVKGIPKGCYVYIGMIDNVVQYIGKGSGDRYKHLNSGKSQIDEVRKASEEGSIFDVYILCDYLTHKTTLALEKSAIMALNPVINKTYKLPNNNLVSTKFSNVRTNIY